MDTKYHVFTYTIKDRYTIEKALTSGEKKQCTQIAL